MNQKAVFQLEKYNFNNVAINLANRDSKELLVDFEPAGIFYPSNSEYNLKLSFKAFNEDKGPESPFVLIECIGVFKFENVNSLEEIPSFFYRNAIAILFPYLRAFVSMVTLQANVPPVVLPTLNLSNLEQPLQQNTKVK